MSYTGILYEGYSYLVDRSGNQVVTRLGQQIILRTALKDIPTVDSFVAAVKAPIQITTLSDTSRIAITKAFFDSCSITEKVKAATTFSANLTISDTLQKTATKTFSETQYITQKFIANFCALDICTIAASFVQINTNV